MSQKTKSKFPDLPSKYSTSRELRNKAEKMRRDRLNMFIDELKKLLPEIASTSDPQHDNNTPARRIDTTKTTILRLATNILKLNKTLKHGKKEYAVADPNSFGGKNSHLELLGGFFIMLSEGGKVLYVSENVQKYTGYSQSEMMGHKISHFAHRDDHGKIAHHLSRSKSGLPTATTENSSSISSSLSSSSSNVVQRGSRQFFHFRFTERRQSKNEVQRYTYVNLMGQYRHCPNYLSKKDQNYDEEEEDESCLPLDANTEYMFLGIIRPVKDRPITELSLMEAIQDQYITRHLPDGRIIFADHRISTILGYLPAEVVGLSAFNFILGEDLPWTTMAQRHMFANAKGEGFTTYRIAAKHGENVILQSRGFLEYNNQTQKVESFLCINSVIEDAEGKKFLEEQRERFSPYIAQFQKIATQQGFHQGDPVDMLQWLSSGNSKFTEITDPSISSSSFNFMGNGNTSSSNNSTSGSVRTVSQYLSRTNIDDVLEPPSLPLLINEEKRKRRKSNSGRLLLFEPSNSSSAEQPPPPKSLKIEEEEEEEEEEDSMNTAQYIVRNEPEFTLQKGQRIIEVSGQGADKDLIDPSKDDLSQMGLIRDGRKVIDRSQERGGGGEEEGFSISMKTQLEKHWKIIGKNNQKEEEEEEEKIKDTIIISAAPYADTLSTEHKMLQSLQQGSHHHHHHHFQQQLLQFSQEKASTTTTNLLSHEFISDEDLNSLFGGSGNGCGGGGGGGGGGVDPIEATPAAATAAASNGRRSDNIVTNNNEEDILEVLSESKPVPTTTPATTAAAK